MFRVIAISVVVLVLSVAVASAAPSVSGATDGCLICHRAITPGIVADWESSRHSHVTPASALGQDYMHSRMSATEVPASLMNNVVGCAECHTMNADTHKDSFDHNGNTIHTVVSPDDCAVCHPAEKGQYLQNLMSNAHINLDRNPVYQLLLKSINGVQTFDNQTLQLQDPDDETNAASCYYCHGTKVEVVGSRTRPTVFGEMTFPELSGWPNQGVGRINPDGSLGSCTACHARHGFSIEVARKPHTCSECHKGPDVPAYKVWGASKMGNLYSSLKHDWDFDAVPWTVGEDFTAPTCAVCHVSLLADGDGKVIAPRSHMMSDRLYTRIFGLVYAHPHPRDPNTSFIKNKAGLNLPTELTGEPVRGALIDEGEQQLRKDLMKKVCRSCHSSQWTDGHFESLDNTIEKTNEMTLTATRLLQAAWDAGAAQGPAQGGSPFDENIEKMWVQQWLYYSNSTRYAAAMAGADYGVYDTGRFFLAKNMQEMIDWLKLHEVIMPPTKP